MLIEPAKSDDLPTPFPPDFVLPMVSPIDLGKFAASRLTSAAYDVGLEFVEGPSVHEQAVISTCPAGISRLARNQ